MEASICNTPFTARRLIIMQGLPGSGKSTYADQLAKQGYQVICRDDIRAAIGIGPDDTGKWSSEMESIVKAIADNMFIALLKRGLHIIIDETSTVMSGIRKLIERAEQYGYECEVHQMNVPYQVCRDRRVSNGFPAEAFARLNSNLALFNDSYDFSFRLCDVWDAEGELDGELLFGIKVRER